MKRIRIIKLLAALSACTVWYLAPTSAFAEGIETVVVTATRTAQDIQNVPLSMVQLSGADLDNNQVRQAIDLQNLVSGLTIVNTASDMTPVFSMRGISLDDINPNNSSPIGVYHDDIYASSPLFLTQPMYDLSRVEVLKGPQGTLYGRNSSGGAINLISTAPGSELGGYASVDYGRWDTVTLEGAVGGPISQDLNFRIAGTAIYQGEGYQTDPDTHKTFGTTRRGGARAQLAFAPTDQISILLQAHYAYDRSTAGSAYSSDTYLGDPSIVHVGDFSTKVHDDLVGVLARAVVTLDDVTLTSITGFDNDWRIGGDNYDGQPFAELNLFHHDNALQFSQELRLASNPADGAMLDWLVGAIYGYDRVQGKDSQDESAVFCGIDIVGCAVLAENYVQKTDSYGFYVNGVFHPFKDFNITLGGRYSHDTRSFNGITVDVAGGITGGPPGTITAQLNESRSSANFSYRAGVDYHFMPEFMVYASVATGYKTGVFFGTPVPVQDGWGFTRPEEVMTEEGGFKARAFDDRVQFNGAIYHSDYKNRQTIVALLSPLGITAAIGNLPKAESTGGELELVVRPFEGFQIAGSTAYTDSRVDQVITNVRGIPLLVPIPQGSALPQAPRWSFNISAQYEHRLVDDIVWTSEIGYNWVGKSISAFGDPNAGYGPVPNLSLRTTIAWDSGWSVTGWAQNLADDRNHTYGFTDLFFDSEFYVQKPRSFGVTLRRAF